LRANNTEPLTNEITEHRNYRQETAVQMDNETHGGEDVALFARGPGADAARGVIDQTKIFNIMVDALGLEP
jgi:alkaline phosphatase